MSRARNEMQPTRHSLLWIGLQDSSELAIMSKSLSLRSGLLTRLCAGEESDSGRCSAIPTTEALPVKRR